MDWYSKIVKIR